MRYNKSYYNHWKDEITDISLLDYGKKSEDC